MIKLVISDLDGVLLDLKELHYEALNRALATIDEKFIISPEEHVKTFDGLSTKKKLKILAELKDFPLDKADEINDLKQDFTVELLKDFSKINYNIVDVLIKLKSEGYLIYVASNSIKNTIDLALEKLGVTNLIDRVYSNQDVKSSKPHPEIYLKCMVDAGVSPKQTVIIEDSKHGREAAVKSGAHVCGIDHSFDFTYEKIKFVIDSDRVENIKWSGKSDVTVLIPMAGAGSRFVKAGYQLPKPLIDIDGKPMIRYVIDNLNIDAQYVFVVQKEHYQKYNLGSYLDLMVPGCKIVQTDGLTEGAACTTLLAKDFINNDRHLLIANSDQLVEWDSCDFMYSMLSDDADGGILTFKANDPKWSYVRLGKDGYVCELAEKKVISDQATCLAYSSPILLSNGKTEMIGKIVNNKMPVEVISFNRETCEFETKSILNFIKNDGKKSEWFKLSYKDSFKTKNGHTKSVIITGDHKILTNFGYQRVDEITESKVLLNYMEPNSLQKEFINGTLLGDGFLVKPNNKGEHGRLKLKQSNIQKEWLNFKCQALKDFKYSLDYEDPSVSLNKERKINSSDSITARFSSNPYWSKEREKWYNYKKIVPKNLKLTPLSLATWYMDNGSLKSNKKDCILCTECFDDDSLNILIQQLLNMNIICSTFKKNKGKAIGIYGKNANKFFELICEYIIPSMQYKIPSNYKNRFIDSKWDLGKANNTYSEVIITKINNPNNREKSEMRHSYCLEIEDNHNFITNNMVVSNCGIYYWKHGSDYVRLAEQMISKDIRVKNEFYVAPVYNELFLEKKRVKIFQAHQMWGLGTPEDLNYFLAHYKDK